VKRRLEQRFENLPHGLHHDPISHVGVPAITVSSPLLITRIPQGGSA